MDGVLDLRLEFGVVERVLAVRQTVERRNRDIERQSQSPHSIETRQQVDGNPLAMIPSELDRLRALGVHVATVQLIPLARKVDAVSPDKPDLVKHTGERAHSIRAARVADERDAVALLVVEDEEEVELLDVQVDTDATVSGQRARLFLRLAGREAWVVEYNLLGAIRCVRAYGGGNLENVRRILGFWRTPRAVREKANVFGALGGRIHRGRGSVEPGEVESSCGTVFVTTGVQQALIRSTFVREEQRVSMSYSGELSRTLDK